MKEKDRYLFNVLALVVPSKIRNIDISLRYFLICLKIFYKEVSYKTVNKLLCPKSLTIFLLKREMRDKYIAVAIILNLLRVSHACTK